MGGLARVGGREMRDVFDDNVGMSEVCLQPCIIICNFFHAVWVGRNDASALRLMKDRIMGAVDLVTPVDVGGEEPFSLALFEHLDFVGGCMGAEHEMLVDIVAVCDGTARMVWREGEDVKVLVGGDEWGEGGEMRVGREVGLDKGAEGAKRMRVLGVQPEGEL